MAAGGMGSAEWEEIGRRRARREGEIGRRAQGLNSLIDGFDWLILRRDRRRGRAGTEAGKRDDLVRKNWDFWHKHFL